MFFYGIARMMFSTRKLRTQLKTENVIKHSEFRNRILQAAKCISKLGTILLQTGNQEIGNSDSSWFD